MSTNHHTAISGSAFGLTTANLEAPLAQLDSAITQNATDIGTNTTAIAAISAIDRNIVIPGGRLSLSSTLPVTTADVSAATSVYYHPYNHEYIATYNGSAWVLSTITAGGINIAIPATTVQMYDVFVYDNSGTATLELTAWTNDTTRATALTYQNGVLCKTGTLTRRYVGSFRTAGVSGQSEDTTSQRFLWNYYHRKLKQLSVVETTNTWAHSTATTWRAANSSTANRVEIVVGVSEDIVRADVSGLAFAANHKAVGVGVDSTTVNSAKSFGSYGSASIGTSYSAIYQGYPGVGYHYLQWIEWLADTTATTWSGDSGTSGGFNSGLVAQVWC